MPHTIHRIEYLIYICMIKKISFFYFLLESFQLILIQKIEIFEV